MKNCKGKTGLRIDPYFSASKIRFILDHNPDVYEKAQKGDVLFGTMDSWIVWKLSGEKHILRMYPMRVVLCCLIFVI